MRTSVLFVCLLALNGCLYIHDSDLQKTAEEAQADFKEAINDGTSERLIGSKGEYDKAVQRAVASADARSVQVQLDALPSQTWLEIINESSSALSTANSKKTSLEGDIAKTEAHLATQMAKLDPAITATSTALESMNAAATAEGRYIATQNLIRGGLKAALGGELDVEELKKTLDEKINVRTFQTADDGTLTESLTEKSVKDLLGLNPALLDLVEGQPSAENAKNLFAAIQALPKADILQNLEFESPGIATTVLGLGYDIARSEEQRIRAEIAATKARYNLQKRYLNVIVGQIAALDRDPILRRKEQYFAAYTDKPDPKVGETLELYSQGDKTIERRQSLAIAMADLARNYQYRIVVPTYAQAFDDQIAATEADSALAIAAVNLHEREAVISRGLEGLVAFHRGGISAEDVANIMRLAQAVGIFAIAGGWL